MSEKKPRRQMPKGGRKGGAVFPRIALSDAVTYGRKLVSKTHTGPQSKDVIYSGVVGAKSGKGNVRVSALKQYGLLVGDTSKGYGAADLARKIASAPADELQPLLRTAALRPTIFGKIYDTYHGDTVSKAKLRQRAADLGVHPDETETCVDLYISTVVLAEIASADGDSVTHKAKSQLAATTSASSLDSVEAEFGENSGGHSDETEDDNQAADNPVNEGSAILSGLEQQKRSVPRAVFNVNVNLDSSLDIDKLQKQLELLKRFGAI